MEVTIKGSEEKEKRMGFERRKGNIEVSEKKNQIKRVENHIWIRLIPEDSHLCPFLCVYN